MHVPVSIITARQCYSEGQPHALLCVCGWVCVHVCYKSSSVAPRKRLSSRMSFTQLAACQRGLIIITIQFSNLNHVSRPLHLRPAFSAFATTPCQRSFGVSISGWPCFSSAGVLGQLLGMTSRSGCATRPPVTTSRLHSSGFEAWSKVSCQVAQCRLLTLDTHFTFVSKLAHQRCARVFWQTYFWSLSNYTRKISLLFLLFCFQRNRVRARFSSNCININAVTSFTSHLRTSASA